MPSQCAEQAAEEAAVAAAAAASAAAASAEVAGDVATASTSTSRFAEISISNAPVHDNGNTTEIATGIGNASFSSTLPSFSNTVQPKCTIDDAKEGAGKVLVATSRLKENSASTPVITNRSGIASSSGPATNTSANTAITVTATHPMAASNTIPSPVVESNVVSTKTANSTLDNEDGVPDPEPTSSPSAGLASGAFEDFYNNQKCVEPKSKMGYVILMLTDLENLMFTGKK